MSAVLGKLTGQVALPAESLHPQWPYYMIVHDLSQNSFSTPAEHLQHTSVPQHCCRLKMAVLTSRSAMFAQKVCECVCLNIDSKNIKDAI